MPPYLKPSRDSTPSHPEGFERRPHVPLYESAELVLDGGSLTWTDLERLLRGEPCKVVLSEVAAVHMAKVRSTALHLLENQPQLRIYGWNQALGRSKINHFRRKISFVFRRRCYSPTMLVLVSYSLRT